MRLNWRIIAVVVWTLIPLTLVTGLFFLKEDNSKSQDKKEFYKVIYVHDGDSFSIDYQGKAKRVRLMGTDAPELSQPYGAYARDALAELILNKNISFIYQTADHYNRFLGRISVVDNTGKQTEIDDVGLELVKRGATWPHRTHKSFRHQYIKAKEEAESNKIGLWQSPEPTKPQEYRDSTKTHSK
jgi:micrococcal nuclease